MVLAKVNFPPFLKHTLPTISYGTKKLGYWCHRRAGFSSFPCSRQRCNINQKQGKGFQAKEFLWFFSFWCFIHSFHTPSSFCVRWGTFILFPHRNLYSQRLLTAVCRCFWTWEPVHTADVTMLLVLCIYITLLFLYIGELAFFHVSLGIYQITG